MIVNDDVTPDSILQLGLGFWSSKALLSAVELGVFTELAKGPLDALTLIERLRIIETRGGFDYTGADCMSWMREAGFRETRVEHLTGSDSMVVAIK